MSSEILIAILSSVVLSSLITSLFTYFSNESKNKNEYIAKHRTETKNSKLLRDIIPKIYDAKNYNELKKHLSNIKRCLNPYYFIDKIPIDESNGKCKNGKEFTSEDIEHDVLIWDLIYKIESLNDTESEGKEFKNYKNKLALYISCTLKFDWDRYQQEVNKFYKSNYKNDLYEAVLKIFYSKENIKKKNDINENKHKISFRLNFESIYFYGLIFIIVIIIKFYYKIHIYIKYILIIIALILFIRFIISLIENFKNLNFINVKYIIELLAKVMIIILFITMFNKYICSMKYNNSVIAENKRQKDYSTINIDVNISTISIIK